MIQATLTIDTREQRPYTFAGCDSKQVQFSIIRAALPAGDYASTLPRATAPEDQCVIERKTHGDLLATLTHGRDRFERELDRLGPYGFKAIIAETDLPSIVRGAGRPGSKVNPKSIVASLIAFMQRHHVHVVFASNRGLAEVYCFRLLERWVRDRAELRRAVSA